MAYALIHRGAHALWKTPCRRHDCNWDMEIPELQHTFIWMVHQQPETARLTALLTIRQWGGVCAILYDHLMHSLVYLIGCHARLHNTGKMSQHATRFCYKVL